MSRKNDKKNKKNKNSYLAKKQAELDQQIEHDKYVNPTKKPIGKILIAILALLMLSSGLISLILLILNNYGIIHIG